MTIQELQAVSEAIANDVERKMGERRNCTVCGVRVDSLAKWRERCPDTRPPFEKSSHAVYETELRTIREYEHANSIGDYAPFQEMS